MDGMRFSPRKKRRKEKCCVFGCKSYLEKDASIRFHRFPKAGESNVTILNKFNKSEVVDKRYAWEKALKIKVDSPFVKVCSLHFKKENYIFPDVSAKSRHLLKTAVPSVNLPTTEIVTEASIKRKVNNEKRNIRATKRYVQKDQLIESKENKRFCKNKSNNCVTAEDASIETVQVQENETIQDNTVNDKNFEQAPVYKDKFVQTAVIDCKEQEVQTDQEIYLNFIKSEKDLNTLTGLSTFELLYFLETLTKTIVPVTQLYNSSGSKLSIRDRIVLTFFKLKQNVSYSILKVMFQVCTEQNCRNIFLRMINILSAGLKYVIYWPKKEEVLQNIPQCFHEFTNVRAVIDVIEMNVESPKKLCCRVASYSAYKSSNTVRFMTAVTPAGLISYISLAYMGRTSDKAIFEESDMINLLEEGDGLMTDKGFLIDEICLKHGIKLIRPPFLRDKKQFSQEEALLNANIAKARVHIERSNQRLKVFKICSSKVPAYLVPKIDQIFTIICAIVNLSSPILKDNKF